MKKLLLIIGIPGAGKSTLANKIKSDDPEFANANIWEADMFFMKDEEYKFNPSILGIRWMIITSAPKILRPFIKFFRSCTFLVPEKC